MKQFITIMVFIVMLCGCVDTSSMPRSVPLNAKNNTTIMFSGDVPPHDGKYYYIKLKNGVECIVVYGKDIECDWSTREVKNETKQ